MGPSLAAQQVLQAGVAVAAVAPSPMVPRSTRGQLVQHFWETIPFLRRRWCIPSPAILPAAAAAAAAAAATVLSAVAAAVAEAAAAVMVVR